MIKLMTPKSGKIPDATIVKIMGFYRLKPGWRHGAGANFEIGTILLAINLVNNAHEAGFAKTDAFPGKEGDITVACYRGDDYFAFNVYPNGLVRYLHEAGTEELECIEDLTMEKAKQLLKTIAVCRSSISSISRTMTELVAVSVARHSNPQVLSTEEAYPFSTPNAQWFEVVPFVPTPENTTRLSPTNRRSFGSSISRSYQPA